MTEGGDIIEEEDEAATKPEVRFFFQCLRCGMQAIFSWLRFCENQVFKNILKGGC